MRDVVALNGHIIGCDHRGLWEYNDEKWQELTMIEKDLLLAESKPYDLVQRLRWAQNSAQDNDDLCGEAADCIERLKTALQYISTLSPKQLFGDTAEVNLSHCREIAFNASVDL